MFGSIGGPELLLILVIALVVFGPRKLPEIGRSMGSMLREFQRASTEFKRTIEQEVDLEQRKEAPSVPIPPAQQPAPTPAPALAPPDVAPIASVPTPRGSTVDPD